MQNLCSIPTYRVGSVVLQNPQVTSLNLEACPTPLFPVPRLAPGCSSSVSLTCALTCPFSVPRDPVPPFFSFWPLPGDLSHSHGFKGHLPLDFPRCTVVTNHFSGCPTHRSNYLWDGS